MFWWGLVPCSGIECLLTRRSFSKLGQRWVETWEFLHLNLYCWVHNQCLTKKRVVFNKILRFGNVGLDWFLLCDLCWSTKEGRWFLGGVWVVCSWSFGGSGCWYCFGWLVSTICAVWEGFHINRFLWTNGSHFGSSTKQVRCLEKFWSFLILWSILFRFNLLMMCRLNSSSVLLYVMHVELS